MIEFHCYKCEARFYKWWSYSKRLVVKMLGQHLCPDCGSIGYLVIKGGSGD